MRGALSQVLRSVRTDPWYGFSVVLTFGLGIGVSTSAFIVLDRIALRGPSGVAAPARLRRVFVTDLASSEVPSAAQRTFLSYPEYTSIVHASRGISEVTAYREWPDDIPLRLNGEPRRARVLGVATNYFAVLGVLPVFGRFFAAPSPLIGGTPGSNEVVISDAFWNRALGREATILGATIDVYHQHLTIVGVAPPQFDGIGLDGPDLWISGEFGLAELYGPDWKRNRRGAVWSVALRLLPTRQGTGVGARVQVALAAEAEAAGSSMRYGTVEVLTLAQALAQGFGREIKFAAALWIISLVLLVTASINAGSFFLARGLDRQQRFAVASALGASRRRIIQAEVFEAVVLALAGGVLGIGIARAGSEVIRRAIGSYIHYTQAPLDPRPFLYATLLAILVGGIASVLPALRATRIDLRTLLDDRGVSSSRDVRRLSAVIHSIQVAFAVVGLYAAALFVRSGQRARAVDLGMDIENVIVATADVMGEGLTPVETRQFWDRVVGELQGVAAVERVALSSLPVIREYAPRVAVSGDRSLADSGSPAVLTVITAQYNRALGIPLISGRDLSDADVATSDPVALINRAGAERLWGTPQALDRCVRLRARTGQCLRIVGIVDDTRSMAVADPTVIKLFTPLAQAETTPPLPSLIVRARPGMRDVAQGHIRRALTAEAPPAAQIDIRPLRNDWEYVTSQWVRSAQLLSGLGMIAAMVTFFGIYGSLSYDLLRRRRELGLRLALGARSGQLLREVIRTALLWCSGGLVIGLIGSVWLALAVRALLFGTNPWDLGVLLIAVSLVLCVGVTAAWLGARRAAERDPAFLLRISR